MNRSVASRRSDALAEPLPPPVLSPRIAAAVRDFDNHRRFGVPVLSEHLRKRAADYVAEADAKAAPATAETVRKWLLPLVAAVGWTPDQNETSIRAGVIAQACSDLPGWGFNAATATAALRKFAKFPSAAEVHALIAEETADLRRTVTALRAIASASGPAEDGPPPSARERDAMVEKLRGLTAEMDGRARQAEVAAGGAGRSVKPSFATPEQTRAWRASNPIVQAALAEAAALKARGA